MNTLDVKPNLHTFTHKFTLTSWGNTKFTNNVNIIQHISKHAMFLLMSQHLVLSGLASDTGHKFSTQTMELERSH